METRRLLIQSVLPFALVLAPGTGWAGDSKGKPATPLIISTGSRAERIKAIQALARSKDPQAIDVLIKELSIMDDGIVAALKTSLRALKAVPVLEQRLRDSGTSEEQKVLACIGLRVLKEKSSIPPLISALKDPRAGVRKEAALALGVIAPAEAEAELLTALSDSDEDVRYFA
ncbi:MAG TPA: HEAT repeat domain-containing protein, partial [Myxococcaceae bacterium]